ncbi:M20 metallopeptidase family protein [Tumebacillus lipolyticus]|uniref:M20 family metallopeptidase n=1 Tax=Tumebacillus lipolyticus TaxID=1280370 RepID=A0ABW5A285_9BACL
MKEWMGQRIGELYPKLVETRRDLHRHPELGFEEVRTSKVVADWLRELGLEVETGIAKTGVVGRLRGAKSGKTVALRADMDALPIQDLKTCDYASTVPGVMHACGHDAHTTIVLGAATLLSELRDQLAGDVLFIFQPAEEGPGGAAPMIEAGVLDGVDMAFGIHMAPVAPAGIVAVSPGPAMASADEFTLTIRGKGGHGAYPHMAIDAIPIAAQVVTALQQVVSRAVDPTQTAVLSIGTIRGGTKSNVIADAVELTGTVRTFDPLLREEMPKRIESIASGIAASFGASAELDYQFKYPVLVNDREAVSLMRKVCIDMFGAARVLDAPPQMSGEDFAYFLQKVPGCFTFLGCKHPQPLVESYNVHHPAFDIDERVLPLGVQVLVAGVLAYLND